MTTSDAVVGDSWIERVQVYARGAEVVRRVRAEVPADEIDLVVPAITALAEPGSFRAEPFGQSGVARDVVAVRSELVLPAAQAGPGPALAQVRELEQALGRIDSELAALAERRAMIERAPEMGLDGRDRRVDPAQRVADALAAAELLVELSRSLDERIGRLGHERYAVERRLEAARLDAAQAPSHERAGAGHPTRRALVRFAAGSPGRIELELTYVVSAARWWPGYSVRLGDAGARAEWALHAFVAQASGEAWEGVALALSTADLIRDARLPELPSLRLSRSQPPARRGYRPPPPGLEQLFAGHDAAAAKLPPPPASPQVVRRARPARPGRGGTRGLDENMMFGAPAPDAAARAGRASRRRPAAATGEMVAVAPPGDDDEAQAEQVAAELPATMTAEPPPLAAPMAFAAPPPPPRSAPAPQAVRARKEMSDARAGGAAAPAPGAAPADGFAVAAQGGIEPGDDWLDFDALVLAGAEASRDRRGRLGRGGRASGSGAANATATIERVAGPAHAVDPLAARGQFDHRYLGEGPVDVPSDARPHRLVLMTAAASARQRFVTVPREVAEVFREVELDNPLGVPLLAGPVDVTLDGALLTTTSIAAVDRGGTVRFGLGVDDRIRVARNVRSDEAAAGLLGGSTVITHAVTIELQSALGHPVTVDVIDRVPVSDDGDVEIEHEARPRAEPYRQKERGQPVRGGLRWAVPVVPGKRAEVLLEVRIKLPAKSELVGGNRRE
jgi:hypothetical protein